MVGGVPVQRFPLTHRGEKHMAFLCRHAQEKSGGTGHLRCDGCAGLFGMRSVCDTKETVSEAVPDLCLTCGHGCSGIGAGMLPQLLLSASCSGWLICICFQDFLRQGCFYRKSRAGRQMQAEFFVLHRRDASFGWRHTARHQEPGDCGLPHTIRYAAAERLAEIFFRYYKTEGGPERV